MEARKFYMNEKNNSDYNTLTQNDWSYFMTTLRFSSSGEQLENSHLILKSKEIIILRLYSTFMGIENLGEDPLAFLQGFTQYLIRSSTELLPSILNPNNYFKISRESRLRLKELLIVLQKEKQLEDQNESNGQIQ